MERAKLASDASPGKMCLSYMDSTIDDSSCMLQVDDFDLTVDSPSPAGAASPDLAPQPAAETAALAAEACAAGHTHSDSAAAGESMPDAAFARTAQWLQAIPRPDARLEKGASGPKADQSSAAESAIPEAARMGTLDSGLREPTAPGQELRGQCGGADGASERPLAAVGAETERRRLTLTAPKEEEPCDGESPQSLHYLQVEPL